MSHGPTLGGSLDVTLLADCVDSAVEFAVVPSFTRIGIALRSRLDGWTDVADYDLGDRVVVITGATSGIGLAAATRLARDGAAVAIVSRSSDRARAASRQLRDVTGNLRIDAMPGTDLADLDAVRALADAVRARYGRVDVLVHNAGALDHRYSVSPQGLERTVASQVVGPFLLTGLLRPCLQAVSTARVVWVSSGGMYNQPLRIDDLEMSADSYRGTVAYARAKRAQVALSEGWAVHLAPADIVSHAMHPGWVDTPGVARSLPTFRRIVGPLLRTPDEGADTLVWLAADAGAPLATTGRFWFDRRTRAVHRLNSTRRSDTAAEHRELWDWCAQRTGLAELVGAPIGT